LSIIQRFYRRVGRSSIGHVASASRAPVAAAAPECRVAADSDNPNDIVQEPFSVIHVIGSAPGPQ
jgi:hypothetical protein